MYEHESGEQNYQWWMKALKDGGFTCPDCSAWVGASEVDGKVHISDSAHNSRRCATLAERGRQVEFRQSPFKMGQLASQVVAVMMADFTRPTAGEMRRILKFAGWEIDSAEIAATFEPVRTSVDCEQ